MPRPRKDIVCIEDTPYYHVTSRCVRRTYLCGVDNISGKNYEHRRQWIVDRIRILSSIFAIEVCSYAVMSNHYHIVLKVCPEINRSWSRNEVIQHWTSLYKGTLLVQKWKAGEELQPYEIDSVNDFVKMYRKRLGDLSWFMKCLNEPIARRANREDECTGHFWGSRFKSQALYTEKSLLSCMVYVDLNPVRAGMAETPEKSEFTSVQERIYPKFNLAKAIKEQVEEHSLRKCELPLRPLSQFNVMSICQDKSKISFRLEDYLELVDHTGRVVRSDKRGVINYNFSPILARIDTKEKEWIENTLDFEKRFRRQFAKRRQYIINSS